VLHEKKSLSRLGLSNVLVLAGLRLGLGLDRLVTGLVLDALGLVLGLAGLGSRLALLV
jgi:hypothetical protein